MKVLLLSPYPERLVWHFGDADDVLSMSNPLTPEILAAADPDYVVSYGYRHIVGPDVLCKLKNPAINLHISILPWNRGSDPNFWSFFDNTPKGVSIHVMDAGLDTGPILAQRRIEFASGMTLATTYALLRTEIEGLFRRTWPAIKAGKLTPARQPAGGTYHRAADKEPYMKLLPLRWGTPVSDVEALAHR